MHFLQKTSVDLGVNLGGRHGCVPQKLLDHAEVGPAFEEMGGKGMAEHVGMKSAFESGRPRVAVQDAPQPHAAQLATPPIQENNICGALSDQSGTRIAQVRAEASHRGAGKRDDAFPFPLPENPHVLFRKAQGVEGQIQYFRDPKPRSVHELEDGPVAEGQLFPPSGRLDQEGGFVNGQHPGEAFAGPGRFEFCGRILGYFLSAQQITVEIPVAG